MGANRMEQWELHIRSKSVDAQIHHKATLPAPSLLPRQEPVSPAASCRGNSLDSTPQLTS